MFHPEGVRVGLVHPVAVGVLDAVLVALAGTRAVDEAAPAAAAVALAVQRPFRGRALLYGVILLPWAVPTAVSAPMWEWIYDAEIGVLNHILGVHVNWLGSPAWALNAAVFMDVWKSTPFVALLLLAGLQGIDPSLYEAARLDGAGAWRRLIHITIPLLRPALLVALVFRALDAFRVFDLVFVLTKGGPALASDLPSIFRFETTFRGQLFAQGAAVATVMFLVSAVLIVPYIRSQLRSGRA